MIIDGTLPEGYVLICNAGHNSHSFLVKRLGPSVECPRCGRTALSADLAAAFIERRHAAAFAPLRPARGSQADPPGNAAEAHGMRYVCAPGRSGCAARRSD